MLTHCCLVIQIWINIGSGNGLLPDGTKPLPILMLTNRKWGLVADGNFTGNAQDRIWKWLCITAISARGQWVKAIPVQPSKLAQILGGCLFYWVPSVRRMKAAITLSYKHLQPLSLKHHKTTLHKAQTSSSITHVLIAQICETKYKQRKFDFMVSLKKIWKKL